MMSHGGIVSRALRPVLALALLLVALLLGQAWAAPLDPAPGGLGVKMLTLMPPRPSNALTGTAFAHKTSGLQGSERQAAALREMISGNVPNFLRTLVPVTLTGISPQGVEIEAAIWVAPDYLAIGSESDFLRMPMDLPTALTVASRVGCSLPTAKIVDAIYEQAAVQLTPNPLPPGKRMRSIPYYLEHRSLIEGQMDAPTRGILIAGHKKDLVLTERLMTHPGQVAIYGWHREVGSPIQPLSTVHIAKYTDYSHGVRLIYNRVLINGIERSIYDVLADPQIAPALTYEGSIPDARRIMTGHY